MYRKKLDRKRIEKHLTIHELASQAGISPNSLSNIINGHTTPYKRTAANLSDALNCTLSEIGFNDAGKGGAV